MSQSSPKNDFSRQIAASNGGPKELISIKEMCALLNISRATLYRYTEAGTFIAPLRHRRSKRTIGWFREDFEAWRRGLVVI